MAQTIRVRVPDLRELRLDLDAVQLGLSRRVNKAMAEAAEPIAAVAKRLAPFDSKHRGWRGHGPHWKAQPDPGHIRDAITARGAAYGAAIVTSHPGGPVHEFGGTIAPKGKPITIQKSAYALTAGESQAGQVERKAQHAVDRLLREHNL